MDQVGRLPKPQICRVRSVRQAPQSRFGYGAYVWLPRHLRYHLCSVFTGPCCWRPISIHVTLQIIVEDKPQIPDVKVKIVYHDTRKMTVAGNIAFADLIDCISLKIGEVLLDTIGLARIRARGSSVPCTMLRV
jgi:hypothetical protein